MAECCSVEFMLWNRCTMEKEMSRRWYDMSRRLHEEPKRAVNQNREGAGTSLSEAVVLWKERPEVHHNRNEENSTRYLEYTSTDATNLYTAIMDIAPDVYRQRLQGGYHQGLDV